MAAARVNRRPQLQLIILIKKIVFYILHSYRGIQNKFSIRVYPGVVVCFLLSPSLTSNAGEYWFGSMDAFSGENLFIGMKQVMRTNELQRTAPARQLRKAPCIFCLKLSAAFAPKGERIFVQSEENHIRTY